MFDLIDSIREKPRAQKRTIAVGVATLITGVIFIFWFISFLTSIKNNDTTNSAVIGSGNISGLKALTDSIQEASGIIKEEIDSAKGKLEFISEEFDKSSEGIEGLKTEFIEVVSIESNSEPVDSGVEITPSGIEIIKLDN
jgi:hypothetical protein